MNHITPQLKEILKNNHAPNVEPKLPTSSHFYIPLKYSSRVLILHQLRLEANNTHKFDNALILLFIVTKLSVVVVCMQGNDQAF